MKHTYKLFFALSVLTGLGAWATVLYKALYIPVTHDELATAVYYPTFTVWELMMYPDPWPNNHILNSILTKGFLYLFGNHQFVLRLANVLSFWLYALAGWKICRLFFPKNPAAMAGIFALLVLNPFVLDFFSLSRGYGMSVALVLFSAMGYIRGVMQQHRGWLWASIAAGMLAAYANFTALVYWGGVSTLVLWYFLQEKKPVKTVLGSVSLLLLADGAYLALVYTPLHKMQSSNQFEYWKSGGFYKETVISMVDNVLYGSKMIDLPFDYIGITAVMVAFTLGAFGFFLWGRHGRAEAMRAPALLAVALLGATVFVNIMQTVVLQTPNLNGRTALLFYPLFILCIGAGLHHIGNRYPMGAAVTGALFLLLGPYHLVRTFSPDRVREWYFDANTFQVLDYLKAQHPEGPPPTLAVDWRMHRSFDFYVQTGKAPFIDLQPSKPVVDTLSAARYYYIFDSAYGPLQHRYEIVAKYDGGARMLMRKRD